MSECKWYWTMFEGAVHHLVCASLLKPLAKDLTDRGHPLYESTLCDKTHIDMPGMVHMKRPWETFQFMGVEISIPSEDVASFIIELNELPERVFDNGEKYYKLHGLYRAFVFTPSQKDRFLLTLKDRVTEAEGRAALFYADKKPASLVLREAAAKGAGKSVDEIPNLGGNKNDRFASRFTTPPKDPKDMN